MKFLGGEKDFYPPSNFQAANIRHLFYSAPKILLKKKILFV